MKKFLCNREQFLSISSIFKIKKNLLQLELFKKSIEVKGDIIEFGVYKGNSLIRLISFNKIFNKRKNLWI